MRWQIEENKRKICTTDFEGHTDDIEMSGEKVSCIVKYGVSGGVLSTYFTLVYPMIRVQPNDTFGSYITNCDGVKIAIGKANLQNGGLSGTCMQGGVNSETFEKFDKVEIDGTLKICTHYRNVKIERVYFPSTKQAAFYEKVIVVNNENFDIQIDYSAVDKIDARIGCKGYIVCERLADKTVTTVKAGGKEEISFAYAAHYANEKFFFEKQPLKDRQNRVNQLLNECDLTTGNDVVDTMFAFAKIRAGESVFNTANGKIHSPGGGKYYAAIWCNDQCEYSTPWFAFTGDETLNEAARTAMAWYEPFMNDDFYPIPSSIISEGNDYWNGVGDRGDAAMYLYGGSRYFLMSGNKPTEKEYKMFAWCAEYIKSQMRPDGVVISNTDELENRISSGVNLSTSSLAYGGYKNYSYMLKQKGDIEGSKRYFDLAEKIKGGIESHFGHNVKGYEAYRYHEGCEDIRAWICLPVYMKILNRKDGVIKAITDKLWLNGGLSSTEGEKITWDRSTLYFISSLFRAGYIEEGWKRLVEFSENRLLGERVPYAIEAYPENGMRHLSAESALFCRIITDGLMNIDCYDDGIRANAILPDEVRQVTLNNVCLNGKTTNIEVKR